MVVKNVITKTGKLKKGFQVINGNVCSSQVTPAGARMLPVFKKIGEPWLIDDILNIVWRLIYLGMSNEEIAEKINRGVSLVERLKCCRATLTDTILYKLMAIESEINDSK
jgi:hypothetical protein